LNHRIGLNCFQARQSEGVGGRFTGQNENCRFFDMLRKGG
jgi:hypothetical protein